MASNTDRIWMVGDVVPMVEAGVRTATGTGDEFEVRPKNGLSFELDVTAAATAAGDTLDVYVQTTLDGTNWVDVVHFTQVLGNGGVKRFFAKISKDVAETMFENATALGAAAVRNIFGHQWRARWAVTDATTDDASFTFSVHASVY